MPKRKSKSLARPGEPKQRTRKGLEIPVPSRKQFFSDLKKVSVKKPQRKSSAPAKGRD